MAEQSSHDGMGARLARFPELAGRVAVVTGAARGMGACFAAGLAAQGAHVLAVDIDEAVLEQSLARSREELGDAAGTLTGMRCDVTRRESHFEVAEQARQRFGRLDIWVSNAGVFPQTDMDSVTETQVQHTFGVNVEGVIYGAQAAASVMSAGGCIVNMASVAAFRVRRGRAVYSATKAAVHNLTRSMAVELGERSIRVNALAPGFIDTEMTNWVREVPGAMEKALASIPLGRIGTPEQVLGALLFLVSDSASYVSGQTLGVDGGSRHG
ncbi:SDR family oxidoreductase [uncultured Castellaniella sp.]|uniref:SDR family NAD(P)-dependent oxidoreductase n=1 Tax=uncultured Castellaniella sp. TaxID=647907 RepID=UPI00262C04F3|nr:SDR family oxidoreductase [uncultured Castellaniella sp.]